MHIPSLRLVIKFLEKGICIGKRLTLIKKNHNCWQLTYLLVHASWLAFTENILLVFSSVPDKVLHVFLVWSS